MRLLYAHFKNLIGVYRSSGRKEITIDFTKCKHNIIYIIGPNGSGKSTIFEALTPLPDSLDMYIPKEPGEKILKYVDGNDIYTIHIKYPITPSGRGVTKAFLSKTNSFNNETIELNPNGNVTSFRSKLYEKFNLDPNFVSLSQLSTDNKGIVDKTPSERKKFVSSVLNSVEIYNNIHKALSKRASNFRSIINSITAKIDTIGDEEKLRIELNSIQDRIDKLSKRKDSVTMMIADNQAIIKVADPDGSIQALFNHLIDQHNDLLKEIDAIRILNKEEETLSSSELSSRLKQIDDKIRDMEFSLDQKKSMLNTLFASREEESRMIQIKKQRLDSLTTDFDYTFLKKKEKELKTNIANYEDIIYNKIGIQNIKLTSNEYITGLNVLIDIKNMIDRMREQESLFIIEKSIEEVQKDEDHLMIGVLEDVQHEKSVYEGYLAENREQIKYNEGLLARLEVLKNRPKECTIQNCSFIVEALDAEAKKPQETLEQLRREVEYNQRDIDRMDSLIDQYTRIIRVSNEIRIILRNISNNHSIIQKLPIANLFIDTNTFLDHLKRGSNFNQINELYQHLHYANIFELYSKDKETYQELQSQLKIYENKNILIEELNHDLDTLTSKLSTIVNDIDSLNADIVKYSKDLDALQTLRKKIDDRLNLSIKLDGLRASMTEVKSKINVVSENMKSIEQAIRNINHLNQEYEAIKNEMEPLKKEESKISHSILQIKDYREELEIYNTKYQKIEMVRKYSSPNSGIQTVFIEMYMGKTLSIANRLLSLLFDGRMQLLDYIINDNEFRIPCKSANSDIINDDIKSCSSAEKAMISMIISFSLLRQSSTKYDILKMDETDSTLDTTNRNQFPLFINTMMELMEVEQCIMISHSSEVSLENIDIIWLSNDNYESNCIPPNGNIIFRY